MAIKTDNPHMPIGGRAIAPWHTWVEPRFGEEDKLPAETRVMTAWERREAGIVNP